MRIFLQTYVVLQSAINRHPLKGAGCFLTPLPIYQGLIHVNLPLFWSLTEIRQFTQFSDLLPAKRDNSDSKKQSRVSPMQRPTVQTVSSAELTRNFAYWQDRAMHGPVTITYHGRPRYVLLAAESWDAERSISDGENAKRELEYHDRHRDLPLSVLRALRSP